MWMFLGSKSICCLCSKLSVHCRILWQVYHGSFLVSRLSRFPFQVTGLVLGFLLHTLMMIFESQGEMVVFLCSPKKGVPFLISSKIHDTMSYLWKEYTYLHLFPPHCSPLLESKGEKQLYCCHSLYLWWGLFKKKKKNKW